MKITVKVIQWIARFVFILLLVAIFAYLVSLFYRVGYGLGIKGFFILAIVVSIFSLLGIVLSWNSYANMGFASTLFFLALPLSSVLLELPFYWIGLAINDLQSSIAILWVLILSLPFVIAVLFFVISELSRLRW